MRRIDDYLRVRHGLLILVSLVLGGCISYDISDLEAQIDEIMRRPGGHIDPIPAIHPYEFYTYQSGGLEARDPFHPFFQKTQKQLEESLADTSLAPEVEQEIKNRNREALEAFALDSLTMVGTLQNDDGFWAVILDPDEAVHRVAVGNYMGRNIGKIVNIFEDRVALREIVKDEQGRWQEREASLVLIQLEE